MDKFLIILILAINLFNNIEESLSSNSTNPTCFDCYEMVQDDKYKCPVQGITDIQTLMLDENKYHSHDYPDLVCNVGYSKDNGEVHYQVGLWLSLNVRYIYSDKNSIPCVQVIATTL